jgi:hypothetical protein
MSTVAITDDTLPNLDIEQDFLKSLGWEYRWRLNRSGCPDRIASKKTYCWKRTRCLRFGFLARINALGRGNISYSMEGKWLSGIPGVRLGRPENIQALALFLASDGASWITGGFILMDGGNISMNSGGTIGK